MKTTDILRFGFLLTIYLWSGFSLSAEENINARSSGFFNFGWKFHWGDFKDAQKNELDDSGWRNIGLPHDFEGIMLFGAAYLNGIKAGGMDLQYVKVYAVDNKGRIVPTTGENEITFEVSGAASLIAVDNGGNYSDELFAGNKCKLHNGFALAIKLQEM